MRDIILGPYFAYRNKYVRKHVFFWVFIFEICPARLPYLTHWIFVLKIAICNVGIGQVFGVQIPLYLAVLEYSALCLLTLLFSSDVTTWDHIARWGCPVADFTFPKHNFEIGIYLQSRQIVHKLTAVFSSVAPCRFVGSYQYFGETPSPFSDSIFLWNAGNYIEYTRNCIPE